MMGIIKARKEKDNNLIGKYLVSKVNEDNLYRIVKVNSISLYVSSDEEDDPELIPISKETFTEHIHNGKWYIKIKAV